MDLTISPAGSLLATEALDRALAELSRSKDAWARVPVARKVEYLERVIESYARLGERQVEVANRARGVARGSPYYVEEWTFLYVTVRTLRLLRDTLRQIATTGRPVVPAGAVRSRPDGQVVVRVFPLSTADRLLYSGFSGEVWLRRGAGAEDLGREMAAFYREAEPAGKVALVLGAGNVSCIGPTDLAQKLFVEGQVCLYKHSPVNEVLAPFLDEAWAELIRDGFVRTCTGGADVGAYLCRHRDVDEIHLTGSNRTFQAVLAAVGRGPSRAGEEGGEGRGKHVTGELGNVSPLIVVPGPWSASDIAFHAESIATQLAHNCGFNCLTTRVLVTHEGWDRTEELLEAVRAVLAKLPPRPAYYPGSEARFDEVMAANPAARPVGPRAPGILPPTLIPNLDATDRGNPYFASECFVPILAQTSLPGASPEEFVRNAVRFCNETLWGTLSAGIVVHPRTARSLGAHLEEAISALRYGTVAVNSWTALGYTWGATTWGAFPAGADAETENGVGTVHNTFLFDAPEKSVVRGPFRVWPKPPWFLTHARGSEVFARMLRLEAEPRLLKLLPIGWHALRGSRRSEEHPLRG